MEGPDKQQQQQHFNNHKQRFPSNTSSSTNSTTSFIDIKKRDVITTISNSTQNEQKVEYEEASIGACASFPVTVITCEPFTPHKPKQPGLRANVFVSKDCTRDLADHIVEENWGNDNGMLYKYLDYIFRCQIFDSQVKKITFSNKKQIVLFHTGLQRREDHNFLYFVLKPNDPEKLHAEQRWRVPAGSIKQSCFSIDELMHKQYNLCEQHLPQRTKFYNSLQELLFDESYQIEVNWPERLRTNKERIYQELKQNSKEIERNKVVAELQEAFNCALKKAENRAKANPRLAVAQGFVETKHYKKRVELLLPLKVEYPKDSKNYHTFALALRKVENAKKYTGMSLLTMSMAYANARLVGYVDSSWLTNDTKKDRKEDKDRGSTHNTSPRTSASNKDVKVSTQNQNQQQQHMVPHGVISNGQLQFRTSSNGRLYATPGNINRARSSGSSGYNNNTSNLATIPSHGPVNVGMEQVNMDGNTYGIQTTNMYVRNPNQWGYNQQQQQQQQQHVPPYIADDRSERDQNPPLSQYESPQQKRSKRFQSGSAAKQSSHLKYSQSALPTVFHPPKLHNKLPEREEDELVNAPPPMLEDLGDLISPRGFNVDGRSEQEIQNQKVSNLKYGASEPANLTQVQAPPGSLIPQSHPTHPKTMYATKAQDYYNSRPVAQLPPQVKKYAHPGTKIRGFLPFSKTHYDHDAPSTKSVSSDNKAKYLLQLSQLPGDCGVNTLRHIFGARVQLQSVHLICDDKTAVLRFSDKNASDTAMEFAQQFNWLRAKVIIDSPYLKNYDQEDVWQYQDSNKWKAHHEEMGQLIEGIPVGTDLLIQHGLRKYFIEKYNKQQGRQTNLRTRNQRMIRRVRVHVWAPPTNPIRVKAIPRIIPTQPTPNEIYNEYIGYGQNYGNVVMQQRDFVLNRGTTNKVRNIGLNMNAPAFDPNLPAIETVVGPGNGINQRRNVQKGKSALIAASTPSKFTAKSYGKLKSSQINKTNPEDIKYNLNTYEFWQVLDDGEPDYNVFSEQCGTTSFSGIWWYSGDQSKQPNKDGTKVTLYYVSDDVSSAEKVFKTGFDESNESYSPNVTLHETVKKAVEFEDPEEDDDNNVKIFAVKVVLNAYEEQSVEQQGNVVIHEPHRIEMIGCCSINISVIKKALNID